MIRLPQPFHLSLPSHLRRGAHSALTHWPRPLSSKIFQTASCGGVELQDDQHFANTNQIRCLSFFDSFLLSHLFSDFRFGLQGKVAKIRGHPPQKNTGSKHLEWTVILIFILGKSRECTVSFASMHCQNATLSYKTIRLTT